VSASIPSSSILLIEPDPSLREIVHRYFSASTVDVCSSFKDALKYVPISVYQVVVCPQKIASLDQYSLPRLNRLHNPCAPFIITTDQNEVVFVQQAIAHGVLGLLKGSPTTEDVIRTVAPLLWLYQLRFSLDRRKKWVTDFRARLRSNPVEGKPESLIENRLMCEQALFAIESGMQALRAYAGNLADEATERMLK
jgi:DNA-binding NtrC family response regulator